MRQNMAQIFATSKACKADTNCTCNASLTTSSLITHQQAAVRVHKQSQSKTAPLIPGLTDRGAILFVQCQQWGRTDAKAAKDLNVAAQVQLRGWYQGRQQLPCKRLVHICVSINALSCRHVGILLLRYERTPFPPWGPSAKCLRQYFILQILMQLL
jgi:hypothetical protein